MRKIIFISIAAISLLAQIANPLWWFACLMSLAAVISLPASPIVILEVIMIVAMFIAPIWSIIFAIKLKSEEIYSHKKDKYFLIINIIAIILFLGVIVLQWRI
ncbi:MAG: hypothetical protein KGJ58_00505 [Patescibacteria group bacterium]|nr:hypothetical protein [Patescibacteria group bacterium]MDE1988563.1 hypothetical protein [Patescibacteria group bacterium]MDE2217923.1 hypothetical protein [Patescibacteria group bacterium]